MPADNRFLNETVYEKFLTVFNLYNLLLLFGTISLYKELLLVWIEYHCFYNMQFMMSELMIKICILINSFFFSKISTPPPNGIQCFLTIIFPSASSDYKPCGVLIRQHNSARRKIIPLMLYSSVIHHTLLNMYKMV